LKKSFVALIGILALLAATAGAQELPKPSFANTIIISIEHSPADTAEVDYIKARMPFGLYAQLSFSVTHIDPDLAWNSDWTQAGTGIAAFKTTVDSLIAAAKAKGVKFHLVVCSGLARGLGIYADAKNEDIRNAQWFNDNNLGTASQVSSSDAMSLHIFGTFSRYARKIRANLEAKSRAAFAFLKQRLDENPDTFVAVSGWGEAELSWKRIDNANSLQTYFCDYSPFAVLEFRDWITHEGLYEDANGKYKGQGWSGGGAKYRGSAGLTKFNADFATPFSTWNLRYYHWSLTDDWDAIPQDGLNNDPGRIPRSAYNHGGMMPAAGPSVVAGGFDPPRTMQPGDTFYDLWSTFREGSVANFVRDGAQWAQEAGIPRERWFSHQIPADYLFGTKPGDPAMNPRYLSSASPLKTANIGLLGSTGATIYDIKFPGWFARTTAYILPVVSAMSPVWAVLEYDPETYPAGFGVTESSSAEILAEYLKIYNYGPALINFWRWWDGTGEHRIKGMNKETALKDFVGLIRDRGRSRDLAVVFDPPAISGASSTLQTGGKKVDITIPERIWSDASHKWKDWGDFDHFEVYRYLVAGQTADQGELVIKTKDYQIKGLAAGLQVFSLRPKLIKYVYAVRAVNSRNVAGPTTFVTARD